MNDFRRSLRWLIIPTILACGDSSLDGTLATGSPGSTNTTGFSAQYILASVQPDPFVPVAGFAQKSVIGRCVEIKQNGTLVQDILYSQNAPVALSRETDTWSYTLSGTDIIVKDPIGVGSGPESKRIGSTTDAQISITRVLRNNGLPVIRTLTFSKVTQLDPRCGM